MLTRASVSVSKPHSLVSVEEGYELWARTYDSDPNPLLALEERALIPLIGSVANKVALDAGSGTGRWLEKLVRGGAKRALGMDISQAMLRIARSKPLLRERLIRGDCSFLPFRSGVADLIISSFALGHVRAIGAFAQELARVSKFEAAIWVSDLHPMARAHGWATSFRHRGRSVRVAAYAYSIEQVSGSFQAHGFALVECQELRLGEPERLIFERAGKSHLFLPACEVPAVCIWHFKRKG
jgi:ubiquinone/menaquinone biosynthesis C-methylase UbiE